MKTHHLEEKIIIKKTKKINSADIIIFKKFKNNYFI